MPCTKTADLPPQSFPTKQAAREAAWEALAASGAARYPFPPRNRIPNFQGADRAAARLLDLPLFLGARRIKVNPDAPQRYVRIGALLRGISVYMATPRLAGGFWLLDPAVIPDEELARAASLTHVAEFAQQVPVTALPPMDVVVCGAVAVTRAGRRAGKGRGYSDLEYGILRELGHPAPPVVTTVHPVQIVADFPVDAFDQLLTCIVTPDETIVPPAPGNPPAGIDWGRLSKADLRRMPVLADLEAFLAER
ncbi:MAG: 5-formyltetrahydrofolate cyclo-ligase [Candidatus Sericytochromatia bacterium]|nr:5-formyltetrahydrofolate cyclo-ligase [Candidatus Tanganyikabacteria bacterium]